jgi:hypothetical protein
MKLVSRIKKIQEDLLTLKEQCHELLAAKQVLSFFNTLEEEIRICIIWYKLSSWFWENEISLKRESIL